MKEIMYTVGHMGIYVYNAVSRVAPEGQWLQRPHCWHCFNL